MTIFDPDNSYRVEEDDKGINVVWGNQVVLALTPDYASQIIPGLTEAYLNSQGWETLDVDAGDLQEGDRLSNLGIVIDYTISFGWPSHEIGVWSHGACVVTFRDPNHKIKVERKISQ